MNGRTGWCDHDQPARPAIAVAKSPKCIPRMSIERFAYWQGASQRRDLR